MNLGQRLRQLRESRGLMQREVGAWVSVDGAMMSKVEKGDKIINRDHVPILASRFGVEEEELQILWLADKVRRLIKNEYFGEAALTEVVNDYVT